MIIDSAWLQSNDIPPVTIVGAGPAGISLALRLEAQGISSLLVEAGGIDPAPESQDFYRGEVVGDPYFDLDIARLRMLGGSSNHWGGWCRPMDAHDFLPREDIPHMGWPIRKADLDPYHSAAADILELGAFEDRPFAEDMREITIQHGHAVRFASKYLDHLSKSDRIFLILNTAVEHLAASDGHVSKLHLRTGPAFEPVDIAPRYVVLACGGIENSRLLLWSNEASSFPVVPNPAVLGRYWMEHPSFTVGQAKLGTRLRQRLQASSGFLFFAPSYEAMRRYGVLNASVRLHRAVPSEFERDTICPALHASNTAFALAGAHFDCDNTLRMSWEQAPEPDNRIELGTRRDRLGVPRPVLHWRKTALDLKTARVGLELFGKALIENDLGLARAMDFILGDDDYPVHDEQAGFHHMGGTRMSDTARTGVVDRNLKVFGMNNLYVAGSSVYPTSGYANPTFTLVQLSLRLGNHLAERRDVR